MPDIRYLCLSDLHFGEEDSLLTNLSANDAEIDPTAPSPTLIRLVDCLRSLVRNNESREKPGLVLLGDVLELALAHDDQAAMTFERFIELALPPAEEDWLFDRIVYIPGNHDHHIWESARETQYVEAISSIPSSAPLPPVRHATKLFVDAASAVPVYLPTRLLRRHPHLRIVHADGSVEDRVPVWAAYPDFGLCSADGARCLLFHHGHYVEPLYHLMSTMKTLFFPESTLPKTVDDIEAENFAWVDFVWSAIGRSGDVGKDIEVIYERLRVPTATHRMLDRFAKELARRYDLPGWGDTMEAALARYALRHAYDHVVPPERFRSQHVLSPHARQGLDRYLSEPLHTQLVNELGARLPEETTFVFGHTHKPFEETRAFEGYPRPLAVYNTGGWVVDTTTANRLHGGAVVLIDEALRAISLRMYNEADDPHESASYTVRVEEARRAGEAPSAFYRRIEEMITREPGLWRAFSAAAASAVAERQSRLAERLAQAA